MANFENITIEKGMYQQKARHLQMYLKLLTRRKTIRVRHFQILTLFQDSSSVLTLR